MITILYASCIIDELLSVPFKVSPSGNQLWQSKIHENSPFINDVPSYSINFHLGPTKNKMVGIQVDQSVLGAAHPNAWGILLDCCRGPEQPHSAGGLNHEHWIYWCFMFKKKQTNTSHRPTISSTPQMNTSKTKIGVLRELK